MTPEHPKFWTVPAIAGMLCIGPEKVLDWLHRGELVGVNVARRPGRRPRWRISDDELQRFLRARQSSLVPRIHRQRRDKNDLLFFSGGRPVSQETASR